MDPGAASITSSPLFSIYGETISGLTIIRAFGMPTKFLKDMTICADTVCMPPYMKINGLWSILEHEPKLLGGWM